MIDEDIETALKRDPEHDDIRKRAQRFGQGISVAIKAIERRKKMKEGSWTTKLGSFLAKLYPIASLSLGLLATIGDVYFLFKLMMTPIGNIVFPT